VPEKVREKLFSKLARCFTWNSKYQKQLSRLGLPINKLIYDLVSTSIRSSLKEVILPEFYTEFQGYDPISVIDEYYKNDKVKSWELINQARYIDLKVWLADMMLVKTDRASMANSLELRPPILDHKFVEYIATLPIAFLVGFSGGKKIFKKALEGIVPKNNLYRKKMGFGVPLEKWYRSELKNRVNSIYKKETRFIRKKYFRSLYESDKNRDFNFISQLNNLIVLESWAQKWL